MHETRGYRKGLRIHLEEPIIEREEEGLAEEVSDSALGDGHGPEVAAAEEVGQQVAGVVEQVPLLRLGRLLLLLVDAGRLAPAPTRKRHGPIDQPLSLVVIILSLVPSVIRANSAGGTPQLQAGADSPFAPVVEECRKRVEHLAGGLAWAAATGAGSERGGG